MSKERVLAGRISSCTDLFYGIFYNISDCQHIAHLSDPVDSIKGLFFSHGIPLWFHEMNAIGCCKIEPGTKSEEVSSEATKDTVPEASTVNSCQQDGAALVFREIFQCCPSLCDGFLAVDSLKVELLQDESVLDLIEHFRPTGEDDTRYDQYCLV